VCAGGVTHEGYARPFLRCSRGGVFLVFLVFLCREGRWLEEVGVVPCYDVYCRVQVVHLLSDVSVGIGSVSEYGYGHVGSEEGCGGEAVHPPFAASPRSPVLTCGRDEMEGWYGWMGGWMG